MHIKRKLRKNKHVNFPNQATVQIQIQNFMQDCWLEISLHPEGSGTGQRDQGFPFLFFGPRAIGVGPEITRYTERQAGTVWEPLKTGNIISRPPKYNTIITLLHYK
jgi:hypothetical protein